MNLDKDKKKLAGITITSFHFPEEDPRGANCSIVDFGTILMDTFQVIPTSRERGVFTACGTVYPLQDDSKAILGESIAGQMFYMSPNIEDLQLGVFLPHQYSSFLCPLPEHHLLLLSSVLFVEDSIVQCTL